MSELKPLEERIKNLTIGLLGMADGETIQVNKSFLEHVRADMVELSKLRRAQLANEPKECPAMERVEGGVPYCSDKQTACDGCKPANEPPVRCWECANYQTQNCAAKHKQALMDFCSHGIRKQGGEQE